MTRPKQPVDLVIAKGRKHLTKEEIEQRRNSEVKGNSDNIFAPSHLTKKQKDRFNYLAEEMLDIKILTNLDVECLARYITLEEAYIKITKALSKINVIEKGDDFDKMLIRQTKIHSMLSKTASELGLTISSRGKLVVPVAPEKKKNKFKDSDNNE